MDLPASHLRRGKRRKGLFWPGWEAGDIGVSLLLPWLTSPSHPFLTPVGFSSFGSNLKPPLEPERKSRFLHAAVRSIFNLDLPDSLNEDSAKVSPSPQASLPRPELPFTT